MALKLNKSEVVAEVIDEKVEEKIEKVEKKEKKSKDEVKSGSVADIIAAIQKTKGDKIVEKGNQISTPRRLPTGIFEFDFFIGGGFPCGRYSILYGPESSCKTNIALRAAAMAQQLTPKKKVVWVNVEQSFDGVWAEKMGVDVANLEVVQPRFGEEAVDLVDAFVRADDVSLLVVDSVAALIANKEVEQSAEKYDIGTSALLIKRMCNKLMVAFAECRSKDLDPCVIFINQTRFKPGVMFGDPETMPGGEAQKFLSSLRVRLYGKNEVDEDSNMVAYKQIHAVIKKAKVPVRAASFDFKLCMKDVDGIAIGDSDSFNMVKGHLQALSLLEKKGAAYAIKFGVSQQLFPSITAVKDKYVTDMVFRAKMQALVLQNYKEDFKLIEEVTYAKEDVPPGSVQSVAVK